MRHGEIMVSDQLVDNADMVAEFLSAIGNGKRFAIMCHLLGGELSVGEIAERVELSQSALSQHLARLRTEGIIDYRRAHRTLYYFVKNQNVASIISALYDIYCAPAKTRK